MLDAAGQPLEAMLLQGINGGFGNTDEGALPISALDLDTGYVDCPRPKTAVSRRCPLWPETVIAVKAALASRPKPKDEASKRLVFVTKYGKLWEKEGSDNPVTKETAKLLKNLKLHRPGLGFYALRHTFETIGGESRDQVAVDRIMGRARDDVAGEYRERISDERLEAVTDHVRYWLFGDAAAEALLATEAAD